MFFPLSLLLLFFHPFFLSLVSSAIMG